MLTGHDASFISVKSFGAKGDGSLTIPLYQAACSQKLASPSRHRSAGPFWLIGKTGG